MFLMGDVVGLENVDISAIQTILLTDEFDEHIVTTRRLAEIIQAGHEIANDIKHSTATRSIVNSSIQFLIADLEFMGVNAND